VILLFSAHVLHVSMRKNKEKGSRRSRNGENHTVSPAENKNDAKDIIHYSLLC